MCIKISAFVFVFVAGCAPASSDNSNHYTGTLTSCSETNPRGGARIPVPDRDLVLDVDGPAGVLAVRPKPATAADSDGWTVDDAANATEDGAKLTATGVFVGNCLADGGC